MPFLDEIQLQSAAANRGDAMDFLEEMLKASSVVDPGKVADMLATATTLPDDQLMAMINSFNELTTRARAAKPVVVPTAEEMIWLSSGPMVMNGTQSKESSVMTLKYTSQDLAAIIPAALVDPDSLARLVGEVLPGIHPDALAEITEFNDLADIPADLQYWKTTGVTPRNIGCLSVDLFGKKGWCFFGEQREHLGAGAWPTTLDAVTMATVAALNLDNCGGNLLLASRIALALSLGLVNYGNDGYSREWTLVRESPPTAQIRRALAVFVGVDSAKYANVLRDMIAFVGFSRLSFTHIYSSSEADTTRRQVSLLQRIVDATMSDTDLGVDTEQGQAICLYSSCHLFSMGGCTGFMSYWFPRPECSPYLTVRSEILGDKAKSVGIMDAGFIALAAVPLLAPVSNQEDVTKAKAMIAAYKVLIAGTPARTSSLSHMLCGLPPISVPEESARLLRSLACLISAGCNANYLPESLGSSYYIKHVTLEMPGICTAWGLVFAKVVESTENMDLKEIMDLIASGKK
jgi:hypothetical protein